MYFESFWWMEKTKEMIYVELLKGYLKMFDLLM